MRRIISAAAAFGLLAGFAGLAAPASANDNPYCGSDGQAALGVVDIGGLVYIDDRNYLDGNGIWVYVETNGQGGLQRGASNPLGLVDPAFNDQCSDHTTPDLNVF